MHYLTPFLTLDSITLDHSAADVDAEIQRLAVRHSAIEACISGKLPADRILDLLDYQGIDPVSYVDTVEANVANAIACGYQFDGVEELLCLDTPG